MSFIIITDTSANLPPAWLREHGVSVIPFTYIVDGEEHAETGIDFFDGELFYNAVRGGASVTTSQINPQRYMEYMRPLLDGGRDILYIGMSSGISGAYESSELAARELRGEYPERDIRTFDTYGASLGEGLLVMEAEKCRINGMSLSETADRLLSLRGRMYQTFMVDDLSYLRKGGRISNIAAMAGTVLHIKPILKGDELGRIVVCGKTIGHRRAIDALAEKYNALVTDPENQTVGIAHADCIADAERLKELIMQKKPPRDIVTVCYEPVTGSHVGPGTLALFFYGEDGVRSH